MTLTLTPDAPEAPAEERVAELERQLAAEREASASRLVRAELKAEAIRAGMVDLDGLQLVDPALVSVGADGAVAGAADAVRALRRTKPWLFGANSSHPAAAPAAAAASARLATEMTYEEWQQARAELLRRR